MITPQQIEQISFSRATFGGYVMQAVDEFLDEEGIVSKGVENTIINVGRLGKDGMRETDKEILKIMTGC